MFICALYLSGSRVQTHIIRERTTVQPTNESCYYMDLGEHIYVVHRHENKMSVHNNDADFTEICTLDMPFAVSTPSGYVSCEETSCLYIGDLSGRCVWKIRPTNIANADRAAAIKMEPFVDKFEGGEFPQSLTVTNTCRVVILLAKENYVGRYWRGRLVVHSKDGTLEDKVPLPRYAANPWCVASIDNDRFAVSYGLIKFGIMIVNMKGKVLVECNDGYFKMPRTIDYDPGLNRLIVADTGNCRVVLLDMQLTPLQVLAEWNEGEDDNIENRQPMLVVLHKHTKKLIVGMESGRVFIYTFVESSK